MDKNEYIATFIGHRDVYLSTLTRNRIKDTIKQVIKSGIKTFWCGAQGSFDGACACILKELKEFYDIKVYVITPYFNESHLKELDSMIKDGYYDGIITPPIEHIPPKYAILARNKYMINNSMVLFSYVDVPFGGAYECYKYAKSKPEITTYNFGMLK